MYAFHNKPEVKAQFVKRVGDHYKADEIIKGTYWDHGKGCAVGCTIHSGNHADYEIEMGIPQILARLEDRIFEGLPNDTAKEWPLRFLKSIKVGADLSLVAWKFLHWLQTENLAQAKKNKTPEDVCKAIKLCVDVLYPMTKGQPVNAKAAWSAARSAAESAAWSARSAAESAAWSAESAAWSAAWSARSAARSAAESAAWSARSAARSAAESAAYVKMADKLIELLQAAK